MFAIMFIFIIDTVIYVIITLISGFSKEYKELNTVSNKNAIYTYYEFIQFKRAIFKCTNVGYDDGTGRIISMSFEFTGKFK